MAAKRRGAKKELEHWLAMQCRLRGSLPPPLAAGDGSASHSCAGKHRRRGALGARFEPILSPRPRSPGWAQTRRGRRCLRSGQVGCARSTSRPSPCAHGSCPGQPSRRPSPSAFSETPSARPPPSSGHPRTPRCSSPPLPVPGRSSKRRPSPAAGFALRRPPHSVFL